MNKNFHWFEGNPEESVFAFPFNSIEEVYDSNAEIPGFFKRIEESGDDKSFVIISSLVVENQLDSFLEILMPGYNKLSEKKDFTFSLKIELLKAHKLIPPIITRCIDYLRRVRNEFAHNLEIEDVGSVDKKILNIGENLYDDLYKPYNQKHTDKTTREILSGILHGSIFGLRSYRPNAKLLRKLLDDNSFKLWMKQISDENYNQEIESLKK